MAQMPIQLVSGRAQSHLAPPPPPGPAPAAPSFTQAVDSATIPGGALRPGAIDQTSFRARMAALNRADPPAGGVPRAPLAPSAPPSVTASAPPSNPPSIPGIPTLTPAQLAALGVDVSTLPAQTPPPAADPATAPADAPVATPDPAAAAPQEVASAPQEPMPQESTPGEPAPQGPMAGARLGADGVWELPRHPGKDEREWLAGMNAKWRIVENPDSVKLFLGEDGKFGFDDFLDIINPLQHIPLVNIAYRELTGDTIDGAAQLLGAIPFGPLSVASNLTDLAFRSETGAGMAENGLAMIFGDDPTTDEIATASGRLQLAEAPQLRRGSNR